MTAFELVEVLPPSSKLQQLLRVVLPALETVERVCASTPGQEQLGIAERSGRAGVACAEHGFRSGCRNPWGWRWVDRRLQRFAL